MSVKKYFFSGIAVIFPVFITIYIFSFIIRFTDNILGKYVNNLLLEWLGIKIPGLGLILAILLILISGFISRQVFSKRIFPHIERFFIKLPFVSDIYLPAKQLSKFFFSEGAHNSFKKAVLIRYPNEWSYSIGFITNEHLDEFNLKTGSELISVLVSTPPSPFSGPIIMVQKSEVRILDMTIDQAIKFVISGGVVTPNKNASLQSKEAGR